MRQREQISRRRKAAKLDIDLTPEILQAYIDKQQCPFCKDGQTFRMLALHISQVHGITAYQLRQDMGFNRHHRLNSDDNHNMLSQTHKELNTIANLKNSPRYQDISTRYSDGGQRTETRQRKSEIANTPTAKGRLRKAFANVDHKAVAARIPPEARSARSRRSAQTRKLRYGEDAFRQGGHQVGMWSVEHWHLLPQAEKDRRRRKAVATTRERHGDDFFRRTGKLGGLTTSSRHNHDHYRHAGLKGAAIRYGTN